MESPLQRLRRLEAEEAAAREGGASVDGKKAGAVAAAGGLLILLLTKGKFLLVFLLSKLKLIGGLLKFGPTYWTMLASAWIYSAYFGWPLAAGFVVTVLLHELGHGAAALLMGLRVGFPIFIPFFGAVIALKDTPRSTWVDAVVGFAGPFVGALCGAAILLAGRSFEAGSWNAGFCRALGALTLTVNLFNLTPVFGLDGDRVTQPLRLQHWLAGLPLLAGLLVLLRRPGEPVNPVLLILVIVAGVKAYNVWRPAAPKRAVDKLGEAGRYADESGVTEGQRAAAAVGYFGLTGALAFLAQYR